MNQESLDQSALQARFYKLIISLQEGLLVENENREVILVNQAFCDMFGYDASPESLIGMDCSGAAEQSKGFFKDPNQFVERIDLILKGREIITGDELEMVNGVFLERDYIPVFIEDKYLGHMWKYKNITIQKNLLIELSKAKNAVEMKNADLQRFAYTASHDLKSPLRGISSLVDWIVADFGENIPEAIKDHLKLMKSRVSKMRNLVDGILKYSKAGSNHTDQESCNLNLIVNNIISKKEEFGNAEIEVINELPTISFKKIALEQVITNLFSNAVKHNDKLIPKVEIRNESGEGNTIITITDNGPGIPERHLDKIFDMFQTFGPNTDDQNNTGLGLSIVKKVMEDHNGIIDVQSQESTGTSFRLIFSN